MPLALISNYEYKIDLEYLEDLDEELDNNLRDSYNYKQDHHLVSIFRSN